MILTEIALGRRTFTTFVLLMIALLGVQSWFQLPKAENPGFEIRTAIVLTRWPGATTAEVERLVTDPIEAELQRMEEVKHLESYSRSGQSVVIVNLYETLTDLQPIWEDLRNKVRDARANLPEGVRGPFVNTDFGDTFGTVLAISQEGASYRQLEEMAELLELSLLELEDAGQVSIVGLPEDRLRVTVDPSVLARHNLTPSRLAQVLSDANVLDDAGFVRSTRERLDIVASGSFDAVEELESLLVPLPGGAGDIPLGQLGEVSRGIADPPSTLAFREGRPAVVVGVSLGEKGNITRLGKDVKRIARRFAKKLPRGTEIDFVAYQPGLVEGKISAFISNLLQGVASVLAVTLLALGLRLGLVVSALVPMSILLSFAVMGALGIGIDQMSLAALIISLGLLVDSGIVIAEAILVEVEGGRSRGDAARAAVKELKGPLFVSVGTTVAALSPTILAESATGEYTAPIAQVVTITLLGAWLLSVTMTPLLCSVLLRKPEDAGAKDDRERYDTGVYRFYRGLLEGALRFRWLVLLAAIAVLFGAFWLNQFVPKAFFPGKKVNLVEAEIELPFDASFPATRRAVRAFEAHLDTYRPDPDGGPGIVGYTSYVGGGGIRYQLAYGPEQPRPNYAYVLVQTTDTGLQRELVQKVSRWTEAHLPGVTLRMNALRNGPPIDYPVSIRLSGLDTERLYAHAAALKRRMSEMDGLLALNDNWYRPVKRIRVDVDPASERAAGVTRADIVRSLRAQTSGLRIGVFRDGTDLVPVELSPAGGPELDRLAGLEVFAPSSGASLPLSRVATLDLAAEPGQVYHFDRRRTIVVRADIDPDSGLTPFSAWSKLRPWLAKQKESWPVGYDFEIGGSVEASSDARASIFAKAPLALALIVLLLVWQYNSLRKPLTILLMLPFGLVGVILALLLTQKAFGFMSFLGVIALFGVLINNGLVLISEIETREGSGLSLYAATVEASQRRARPIILTALTTVGGLVPLAVFGGPLFSPLGTAMLGGLVIGTGVTLVLCPTIFATLHRVHPESAS